MAEINTIDDLTTFLSAVAKDYLLPRHNQVSIHLTIVPEGLRLIGMHHGQSGNKIVPWILVVMSNGADVHSAITAINRELLG